VIQRLLHDGRAFLALSVIIVLSIASCGGSSKQPAGSAGSSSASAHASGQSSVKKIAVLCTQAEQRIAAIPEPPTQDPSVPQAIRYEKRVVAVFDQLIAEATAVARSAQSSKALADAFTVERRGQKFVDAQIPALEHHDVARTERLAQQARALTAPADAAIRRAGLAMCVGG
jgi:hypothetical protein